MNLAQKLSGIVSLSRRCLITPRNARFLSSETQSVQPRNNAETQIESAPPATQKDKLYSRLEIELIGIEPEVMKSYAWYATRSAEHLGIQVGKCYPMRKYERNLWTLLKAVHVHAKAMAQYQVRTYHRFLNFHNLTQSTLETFLEYIQRNLPEGTKMKATKVEIQKLPEHLQDQIK